MRHFYDNIPGWFHFDGMIRLLVATLPDAGCTWVEVGTWKGRSAAFTGVELINQRKRARFVCVDTWRGSDEEAHREDPDVQAGRLFEVCRANLAPIADRVEFIRQPSTVAAAMFKPVSCDVVLLDAGHTFEAVLSDLCAWADKVKPGGYLAGDDVEWPGVSQAINQYFVGNPAWQLNLFIGPSGYPAWLARKEKSPE